MQLFAEGKLSTIYGCNIRWRVEIFFLVELFNDAFLFPIYKKYSKIFVSAKPVEFTFPISILVQADDLN